LGSAITICPSLFTTPNHYWKLLDWMERELGKSASVEIQEIQQ